MPQVALPQGKPVTFKLSSVHSWTSLHLQNAWLHATNRTKVVCYTHVQHSPSLLWHQMLCQKRELFFRWVQRGTQCTVLLGHPVVSATVSCYQTRFGWQWSFRKTVHRQNGSAPQCNCCSAKLSTSFILSCGPQQPTAEPDWLQHLGSHIAVWEREL